MRKEGKHVIPMPGIEVKKELPNYWIDSIFSFIGIKNKNGKNKESEKAEPEEIEEDLIPDFTQDFD